MSSQYRLDKIYANILRNGSMKVDQLAELFQVTPTTIRRDLLILEEKQMIFRSRGAAHIISRDDTSPGVFSEEKRRIGEAAARLITNGITLSLDSGSTVGAFITTLLNKEDLSELDIITHSISTAMHASQRFNVSIPGGAIFRKMDTMIGLDVESFYKSINVDYAFLGSTGVYNCAGLTLSYPVQLLVKTAAAQCADKRIALLDSSKFIKRGIYVFCKWEEIDQLITVKTAENQDQIKRIEDMGVKVTLA